MSRTDPKIIDVALDARMVKGKAQAFSQGEIDENDREIWIWLPLSQIEINDDGTVSMPEWLAHDKGLI